jgi:hypothetical protein
MLILLLYIILCNIHTVTTVERLYWLLLFLIYATSGGVQDLMMVFTMVGFKNPWTLYLFVLRKPHSRFHSM